MAASRYLFPAEFLNRFALQWLIWLFYLPAQQRGFSVRVCVYVHVCVCVSACALPCQLMLHNSTCCLCTQTPNLPAQKRNSPTHSVSPLQCCSSSVFSCLFFFKNESDTLHRCYSGPSRHDGEDMALTVRLLRRRALDTTNVQKAVTAERSSDWFRQALPNQHLKCELLEWL